MTKNLMAVLVGLLVSALLLEVAFQFLPVTDAPKIMDVNEDDPYMHFEPNKSAFISIGRAFEIQNTKAVNNYGFFSDKQFERNGENETFVVIGDSYVEAMQVENYETVHGVLDILVGDQIDVYGIGTSGSPLSQYLAYAKFAQIEFEPEAFIFFIIGNDYDESLLKYKNTEGHHFYNDSWTLVRNDFERSFISKVARKSATARYLFSHLKIQHRIAQWIGYFGKQKPNSRGPNPFEERLLLSKLAVQKFLVDLKVVIGEKPAFLIIDGRRGSIYEENSVETSFQIFVQSMNDFLVSESVKFGFSTVDLHTIFLDDYEENGERFEFETDWHWNARGHRIAANEVFKAIGGVELLD